MKDTPWMDGPPYITQCPISPGQIFTYMFKATPERIFPSICRNDVSDIERCGVYWVRDVVLI
jgi:hypothetical protein